MKQDILGMDDLTDLDDMDIEFDEGWQNVSGVHSTVIGDSHIRKGIVCQDSSGTVVTDKFAIAVVADGHGSAKHFRSDVGSRIAVKITTKLLKNYMNRQTLRSSFKHPEFILAQMEKQILMKWREAVEEYHLENPLTEEEENKIPEKAKENLELQSFTEVPYWQPF